ncbi:hypothetical protein HOC80_02370 [archaeon]|jgi:hypothetical protein|nr:hypothetical protein [archaeon]MBT4416925.1 hypothetical protein [archaeon]
MKKLFFLILVTLVLISIASAQELQPLQEEYLIGETIQASYNGTTLSTANIYLLDNESTSISIAPLITNYDQFFFYFNLPTNLEEGIYTLIANIEQTNLTLTQGPALTIKPGIVYLNDDSFQITIQNVGTEAITAQISATDTNVVPRKTLLTFQPDEQKNLFADYSEITQSSELIISYGSRTYSIPLITDYVAEVIENVTEENITIEENVTVENTTIELVEEIDPLVVLTTQANHDYTLFPDETLSGPLSIENNLNESLNIEIVLTENLGEILSVNITEFTIPADSVYTISISINERENASIDTYIGELQFVSSTETEALEMQVEIVGDEEAVETTPVINFSVSSDGTTTEESGGISGTLIIGIVLIMILLGIFFLLYSKMKQPVDKDFNKVVKERTK